MYDSYYEQPEPTQAEQDLFDSFADKHPEWTDQQLWDAVDAELDARRADYDEYAAEQRRDLGEF